MAEWIPLAVKVTVFALMLVVGLDCTVRDLGRNLRRVGLVSSVGLGQFLLIPLVTVGICRVLGLRGEVVAGLLLMACCPAGTISNSYAFLGRGNTALSVALTAISCLVAALATPGSLWLAGRLVGTSFETSLAVPPGPLFEQLALMLALPVVLGLLCRHRFPDAVRCNLGKMRLVSLVLLVALIALICASAPEGAFLEQVRALWLPALLLTVSLLALGLLVAGVGRLPHGDAVAILFELPCRNLAVVALVGVSVLDRPELVVFAVACFVVQAALLLIVAGIAWCGGAAAQR